MPVIQVDITTDDLEDLDWKEILQDIDEIIIHKFATKFDELIKKYQENSEDRNAAIMALLSAMCKVALKTDPNDEPFKPFFSSSEGRTPIPEDLSENEKEVLADFEDKVDDPELTSRFADILWVTKKDHRAANRACDAYVESAKRLENNDEFSYVSSRLERAVALAALFGGQGSDKVIQVLDVASEILRKRNEEKISSNTIALLDLLIDRRHGDLNELAEIAKEFAEHLQEIEKYDQARMFWNRSAKAYQRSNESASYIEALKNEAESYVHLADGADSEMAKASFVRSAFEAYRQIPNTEERRNELHERLLKHQEKSVEEMGTISTPVNLGEMPSKSKELVRNQDLIQALYSLSLIVSPVHPEKLKKQAEKSAQDHPMAFMLTSERVNALGRVVGIKPGGMDDPDGAIESMIHDDLNRLHMLRVAGRINPAREQIISDHPLAVERDLENITHHNSFIPAGRKIQFSRGLIAGLKGDFLLAAHFLIPQIENSLRVTLQRMSVITTGLDSSNRRQNEQSLNVTLYDYQKELEHIFGPEVIFELKNLLVEPMGANLRNEAMHGLLDDNSFYSYPVIYLWWLTLRLCCFGNQGPLPEGFSRETEEESEVDEQDTSEKVESDSENDT